MTTYPPVQCTYSEGRHGAAYHRKVWLTVGTTRRLFEIGLLENFIHYGLDYRTNRSGCHGPKGPIDPWALPYRSPEDELPDGPGILPKSLRRGLLEILPRLHQRGFLIFHDEALKTRPQRGHLGAGNMALWYREVLRNGDWQLTPVAKHLFTAAKAWLEEQLILADSGAFACFSLDDNPLPQDVVDRVEAHCSAMGARAQVIANDPKPERKSSHAGPHLLFSHDPLPGTYWLKQEDRAQDHFLEGVWRLIEAHEGKPVNP